MCQYSSNILSSDVFYLFGKVKWNISIVKSSYHLFAISGQMSAYDLFFAGMKSWQMLTAGIGMNIATLVVKSSPRSSRLHFVQTFYHFVCWLKFKMKKS